MAWKRAIVLIFAVLLPGYDSTMAGDQPAGDFQLVSLNAETEIRMSPLRRGDRGSGADWKSAIPEPGVFFDLAVHPREYSFAESLLNSDASPLTSDYTPASAMLMALGVRDLRLLARLLEKGIDPNLAIDHPVPASLVNLFENPFLVRELTKDSRVTPLMVAVLTQQQEAVRILMHHGANTEICTRVMRMYPLDFAAELKDIAMMQLLLGREPTADERGRRVIISLSAQKAWLMDDGNVLFETAVSTGRAGFPTRTGEFVITQKYPEWKSTLYKAPMPNFMRLNCGQAGLHSGYVPGVPASHGCVRLPPASATAFYTVVRRGDRVTIVE